MLDFPTIEEAPATAPEVASEVVDRAQIVNGTPLVKYSATEAGLLALKAELAGKVYDLKTTKGDQAARADRLRLRAPRRQHVRMDPLRRRWPGRPL